MIIINQMQPSKNCTSLRSVLSFLVFVFFILAYPQVLSAEQHDEKFCSIEFLPSRPDAEGPAFEEVCKTANEILREAKIGETNWLMRLSKEYMSAQKYEEAMIVHRRLIELSDSYGYVLLADQYFEGLGTPTDTERAISIYEEGVIQGSHVCAVKLGYIFFEDKDAAQDKPKSYAYMIIAGLLWKGDARIFKSDLKYDVEVKIQGEKVANQLWEKVKVKKSIK